MTTFVQPTSDISATPPTAFVLSNRPLCENIQLETTSRFGDDVWVLTPAEHQVHKRRIALNFPTVPSQFRETVKELCFALLTINLPPGHKELRVVTIYHRFVAINEFLRWVDHRGGTVLRNLTVQDLLDFQTHIKSKRNSRDNELGKLGSVRLLWQFRSKLTSDALPLDPNPLWFDPTTIGRRQASRPHENQTPRIPEQVLNPLMIWALRWVEEFTDDVLRSRDDWADLNAMVPEIARIRGSTRQRLVVLLSEYRADGRPLPQACKTPMRTKSDLR